MISFSSLERTENMKAQQESERLSDFKEQYQEHIILWTMQK